MRAKAHTLTSLDVVIAATIVGYWIGVSLFPDWTGGWSYGPRLLADVVPLMVWFLPPIFEALARSRNTVLIGLASLLVVLSVAIQARGAFVERTATWNWEPRFWTPHTSGTGATLSSSPEQDHKDQARPRGSCRSALSLRVLRSLSG